MFDHASPWMDHELLLLRDSAKKFFTREFLPHEETWIKNGSIDRDAWRKVGAAGLLCASISEEFGGGGGTFAHEVVIIDQQIKAGVSSFGGSVHSGMVAHYINSYANDRQKREWFSRMATGEYVGAVCMTEPGTGSDLQSVKTTARLDGDSYVINGSKTFITNGKWANILVVVAKTDASLGARGISLLVVETDKVEGFSRGKILDKIGYKGLDTVELFFDNVRVPRENLLGGIEGGGFVQLMNQLPQERLIIAVQALASMERALSLTTDYVRTRTAFGKTIFDQQNTRMKLAEAKMDIAVARAFVDDCISRHMRKELDATMAAIAKVWCSDKQNQVIDRCLQLHGGYGYVTDFPISRMYVDARVQRIYGGSNEVLTEFIARSL